MQLKEKLCVSFDILSDSEQFELYSLWCKPTPPDVNLAVRLI